MGSNRKEPLPEDSLVAGKGRKNEKESAAALFKSLLKTLQKGSSPSGQRLPDASPGEEKKDGPKAERNVLGGTLSEAGTGIQKKNGSSEHHPQQEELHALHGNRQHLAGGESESPIKPSQKGDAKNPENPTGPQNSTEKGANSSDPSDEPGLQGHRTSAEADGSTAVTGKMGEMAGPDHGEKRAADPKKSREATKAGAGSIKKEEGALVSSPQTVLTDQEAKKVAAKAAPVGSQDGRAAAVPRLSEPGQKGTSQEALNAGMPKADHVAGPKRGTPILSGAGPGEGKKMDASQEKMKEADILTKKASEESNSGRLGIYGNKNPAEIISRNTEHRGSSPGHNARTAAAPTSKAPAAEGENMHLSLHNKQPKEVETFLQQNISEGISMGLENSAGPAEMALKKRKGNETEGSERERSRLPGFRSSSAFRGFLHQRPVPLSPPGGGSVANADFTIENFDIWERHTAESGEGKEEKEFGQAAVSGSVMRLEQIPITNATLRRQILPGLAKTAVKAASEAKKAPGQWQKHNFALDDGKEIQLSVRESKGVLQVKLGSLNMDLSKLLQQNLQQIREHLKQEFDTDIDLHFEHNEQQDSSESKEDSRSANRSGNHQRSISANKVKPGQTGQNHMNSVRKYGYNQMEWTA